MSNLPNSPKKSRQPSEFDHIVEDMEWVNRAILMSMRPVPRMWIWEWADKYRMLPPTAAEPGKWHTLRVPYTREVMECLSPYHPCEEVVVMKGAQLAFTELGLNWIGFTIHHDQALMLVVMPGLSEVKRNTNTRLNPLIEYTPAIKGLVTEVRSKEGGNSVFRKAFPNGELIMTGANSARGLSSTPVRKLMLDEVDRYPLDVDGEGDPVNLAKQRTVTFRGRRKHFLLSTPTVDGISRIKKAFDLTDQRRYFVPCRKCGRRDWIRWDDIHYSDEGGPDHAGWVCPDEACGHKHYEHDKLWLLEQGEWIATAEGGNGRTVGFHLSALYSPFETWAEIAQQFIDAQDDATLLKTWVNTKLGETWKEAGDAPEWQHLYNRRESYPMGIVPEGGVVLTAGVDVQADRLEVEIVAWGPHNWSWSVDYRVLAGNTGHVTSPAWADLSALLDEQFTFASGGEAPIRCMAVDDGYNSQTVRDWARHYDMRRVIVVKGQDSAAAPLGLPSPVDVSVKGKKLKRGMKVWPVGVSHLKSQLYNWLRLHAPSDDEQVDGASYPPGYCHFPEYPDEYFQMLTAEALVRRIVKGYPRYEWVKTRTRNEALDTRNYARAAYLRIGVHKWSARRWAEEEQAVGLSGEGAPPPAAPPVPPPSAPPPVAPRPRRGRRAVRTSYMER